MELVGNHVGIKIIIHKHILYAMLNNEEELGEYAVLTKICSKAVCEKWKKSEVCPQICCMLTYLI
jgi:hypothetical protein